MTLELSHAPLDSQAPPWWLAPPLMDRFLADFLHAELRQMRRSSATLPPLPWAPELHLEHELGVDSLERFALASALSITLDLPAEAQPEGWLDAATLGDWSARVAAALSLYHPTRIAFKTSGSSGLPKRCHHALALLWEEARFFADTCTQAETLCFAVPAHHIYGFLFTILLPQVRGLPASRLRDLRRSLPSALPGQADAGSLIIGYPEFWAAAAASALPWPAGATGISSTAPLPPAVGAGLRQHGLRLLEVYGSSETAGVGWRSADGAPYALLPYWQRGAAPEVLQRPDHAGAWLRAACQDAIEWRDARHFLPGARHDQAVQVGGTNVYPAQVAALLQTHPAVRAAAVRLMRPDEGSRLKAFIVPAEGATMALAPTLAQWLRERLPAPARPVAFTLGDALPVTAQGKLCDWDIADAAKSPLH